MAISKLVLLCGVLLVVQSVSAQTGTLAKTIEIRGLQASRSRCTNGSEISFVSDDTLLISTPLCEHNDSVSRYEIATASLNGQLRESILLSEDSRYPDTGLPGYIFIPVGEGWSILDDHLHLISTLPAKHAGESEDGVLLSPNRKAVALIFAYAGYLPPYRYIVMTGAPLQKKSEITTTDMYVALDDSGALETSPTDHPVHGSYETAPGERWYFDPRNAYQLTRKTAAGITSIIPDANWLAPHEENTFCHGQVSTSPPRRFLAICSSGTAPFGRALPVGWSHNRFIVYGARGEVLLKQEIAASSAVALAPGGHMIAVSRGKSVDLYTF